MDETTETKSGDATQSVNPVGTSEQSGPGAGSAIYWAFAPWVVFTLVSNHATVLVGALLALAVAIAVAIPSFVRGRPKVLEIAGILAFIGFATVSLFAGPDADGFIAEYARAIAAAVLALVALLSLPGTPFTAQYARDVVPRQYWASAEFLRINRRLTLMWAGVFAVMVPSHLVAGALGPGLPNLVFNWLVPVGLVIWAVRTSGNAAKEQHS